MGFDSLKVRTQFPALNQTIDGVQPVFLDGPGGAQVPAPVMDAMTDYLRRGNSNLFNSPFFAVRHTHEIVDAARAAAAAFVNGAAEEIVFGANMSTLTAHLSRSLLREMGPGDEIVVTDLDHFANVSFWAQAAADRQVTVRRARIDPADCTLDTAHLESLIGPKTKLVAFTLASNLCGSLTEARRIVTAAQAVGALTYVDAVHYAPHFLPDVRALGCDFLVCSAYKFCGPHQAFVWGRRALWEAFQPYRVEAAPAVPPDCWETGTKSFEALAGLSATVDYLASFGDGATLRARLVSAYARIAAYEMTLSKSFLARAATVPGMRIYGITDPAQLAQRTATFAFTVEGFTSLAVSNHLARNHIAAGAGSFYAPAVIAALGPEAQDGVVRAGALHYNTIEDLEQFFVVLKKLI